MEEIWKDVVGYEGYYKVSNIGNVMSVDRLVFNKRLKNIHFRRGAIMSLNIVNGYYALGLAKGGVVKSMLVHRLVATAFIPNPENKPQVNHKDFNRKNNNINNLEWVTLQENLKHRDMSKHNAWLGKKGYDHNCNIPVYMCNKDGDIITDFGGMMEAQRQTVIFATSISYVCKGER